MKVLDSIRAEQVQVGDQIIGSDCSDQLVLAITRTSVPGVPGSEVYLIYTTDPVRSTRKLRGTDKVLVSAFTKVNQ